MSIRWDCEKDGCYKDKCIPDWGFLNGLLPRGCRPTDIDGIVELDGRFLVLEWKGAGGALNFAQRKLFERLTKLSPLIVVAVLFGNTEQGTIAEIQIITGGVCGEKQPYTTEEFIDNYKRWGSR